jgi:hypothetical protein
LKRGTSSRKIIPADLILSRKRRAENGRLSQVIWLIVFGIAFKLLGVAFVVPNTHQTHLLPQFQALAITVEQVVDKFADELMKARNQLPSKEKLPYTAKDFEIAQRQIAENIMFMRITSFRAKSNQYLRTIAQDLADQKRIGVISDVEYEKLMLDLDALKKVADKQQLCMTEADDLVETLSAGLEISANEERVTAAKVASIKAAMSQFKETDPISRCVQQSGQSVDQVERLVELHDSKVDAFNKMASRNQTIREYGRSLFALPFYAYGRSAWAYIWRGIKTFWTSTPLPLGRRLSFLWANIRKKQIRFKKPRGDFW